MIEPKEPAEDFIRRKCANLILAGNIHLSLLRHPHDNWRTNNQIALSQSFELLARLMGIEDEDTLRDEFVYMSQIGYEAVPMHYWIRRVLGVTRNENLYHRTRSTGSWNMAPIVRNSRSRRVGRQRRYGRHYPI